MSSDYIDERAMLARHETDLAQTEDERDRLGRKSAALQKTIAGLRELIGLSNGSAATKSRIDEPVIPQNAFTDMGILEAVERFLRTMKTGQTNREISNALTAGGLKTEAEDPYDTIRNVLRRDAKNSNSRFIWKGGKWELTEWQE